MEYSEQVDAKNLSSLIPPFSNGEYGSLDHMKEVKP